MALRRTDGDTWRGLSDEELRHYRHLYRRMRVNLPEDVADEAVRTSTAAFLDHLLGAINREIRWRRRAAERGVAIQEDRFTPAFVADLKARVRLDELLVYELGARLGRLTDGDRHNGECPFCGHRDCFSVYLADEANQHYHCFSIGCRASGDAITAIQAAYGDSFHQAIERLARKGQIPLPPTPTHTGPVAKPFKKRHRGAFLPP